MFDIRTYQPADEAAVLALWNRCGLVSLDSNPPADIRRKLSVQPELFLVGRLDSAVIASAMAGYDGHRGYLYYLAVSPEHQRKGYGRAIVAHLQRILHERGCPKLNLFVSPDNLSASAFYERLGFTRNDMVSMGRPLYSGYEPDTKSRCSTSQSCLRFQTQRLARRIPWRWRTFS